MLIKKPFKKGMGPSIAPYYKVAGAAFTPASLTGLIGWYKADAGVFSDAGITPATNGGTVQQWNDQSGTNNHLTQATGGSRPTYTTNSLNSLPTIDNGGTTFMDCPTFSLTGGDTSTLSFFFVVKATATTAGRAVYYSNTTDTGGAIAAYFASLTAPTAFSGGNLSSGTVVSGSWNQIGSIWDGANNTMYIGGTGQTPAASTTLFVASGGNVRIFTSSNAANPMAGSFAELIITNNAIGSTDRSSIHTYFLNKWGV